MKKTNTPKTVLILGGGLAGLAAAYELTRKKFNVTVIEMQDDVGGLARTIEVKGFRFDTGPHRWYTKSDMVNQWLLEFMGDEIIKIPRLTRIYFDKKFFYYPIKFKNVISGIGLIKATQSVIDYLWSRVMARVSPKNAITLEDGYIEKFGNTLYKTFFKRYSEKLWGRSCKEVSSDWIGQRTRGFNIGTIIKDALFKTPGVVSFVDEFSYPKQGIGRIADKLAEEAKKQGGVILVDSKVTKIEHSGDQIKKVTVQTGKKMQEFTADYIISTIPLSDLVFSLSPRASSTAVGFAKKLSYRDQVEVALFINKENITPDTWIYVHPENISFMRMMEMANWNKQLSPKGKTTLVFEISCDYGDRMWSMKDSELIKMVSNEFVREFGLISDDDILGGYVHRVEKEYPVYHIGYRTDVDSIKHYVKQFKNLQIAGRNGTFRYNNMDHSIEMGLYAAWNIIEGKHVYDIESVNIEREYLEEKKLELPEDEYVEKEE